MEKIITINTKKTASDTALVELSPGNALDTVDPSISIDKWSFVIVFFLALLDPYLIFQIAIIIALFIYLLFFFRMHSTWFRVLGIMVAKKLQLT